MLRALGDTALIPRSFNIEANPRFTENVEQEFLRDRVPLRGVGGQLYDMGKENILKYEFKSYQKVK